MRKLIIGNWKLNPKTIDEAIALGRAVDTDGAVICPPHAFLEEVANMVHKAHVFAQDIFWQEKGKYTGGVSAAQLKTINVKGTLVGHSSRRELGETDKDISKKVAAALSESLWTVLCVGEPATVHSKGEKMVQRYVIKQLRKDLKKIKKSDKLVIAYEPIWAIGTKHADTPESSVHIIEAIKAFLQKEKWPKVMVLYGGSVNQNNAQSFLRHQSIDGLLIGEASLDQQQFNKIVKY